MGYKIAEVSLSTADGDLRLGSNLQKSPFAKG
jgi:hypothetical protein